EGQRLGDGAGFDRQIRALAGRVEIGACRTDATATHDRRLAHGDTVLPCTVVVRIVLDADLGRRPDQRLGKRTAGRRIGYGERTLSAAELVVTAAAVALHALEERQHVAIGPVLVPHLRPGVVVLRLAAHEGHAVDRARAAEQPPARHRDAPSLGVG